MFRITVLLCVFFAAPLCAAEPGFALTDLDGKVHRLSDYRGRWVVVNYWATWCPPCREEIPELVHFHEEHKDSDGVVLGINMESPDSEYLISFVDDNFVTYPVLRSEPEMAVLGPVPGLPTTFLVNPKGEVVAQQVGPITKEGIESFIASQPESTSAPDKEK